MPVEVAGRTGRGWLDKAALDQGRGTGEGQEADQDRQGEDERPIVGARWAGSLVEAELEGQGAVNECAGQHQANHDEQAVGHDPERAQAGHGGQGRQDRSFDRNRSRPPTAQEPEGSDSHRGGQQAGHQPAQRTVEQA